MEPEKGRWRHKPTKGNGIHWRIRKEKGSADPRDKVTWGGLGRLGTLLSPVGCDLKVVFSGKWVPLEGKG